MPDKYSLAACEQYGRRLASQLCQQHFGPHPEALLDGPALLKLTPLRQLNLLVLQQLLGRWQHEASQLRSPYFNFEAEPVQAALGQFMNVLSRHLAVGRTALEPLLTQAATTTLLLALDPAAAFERVLLPPASTPEVPAAYLRERLRYLDAGKALFEGFVASLPAEASLSRQELQQRFEQYQADHAPQQATLAPLLAELSTLLPVSEAELRREPAAPPAAAEPAPAPADAAPAPAPVAPVQHPAEALAEARAQASEAAEPTGIPPAPAAPTEAARPAVPAAPADKAAPAAPPAARPVPPSFVTPEAPAGVPLHEKLRATQPATAPLASALRGATTGTAPSLAERGAPRVGSLREAISINQRYSFINELFNGENMDYHAAIAHLDELPNAEAAQAYVQQELAPRHDWGRKEEHVAKLLKLIERKFAPGA